MTCFFCHKVGHMNKEYFKYAKWLTKKVVTLIPLDEKTLLMNILFSKSGSHIKSSRKLMEKRT